MGSKSTVCHDDVDDKKFPVQCITQKACPCPFIHILYLKFIWIKSGWNLDKVSLDKILIKSWRIKMMLMTKNCAVHYSEGLSMSSYLPIGISYLKFIHIFITNLSIFFITNLSIFYPTLNSILLNFIQIK